MLTFFVLGPLEAHPIVALSLHQMGVGAGVDGVSAGGVHRRTSTRVAPDRI